MRSYPEKRKRGGHLMRGLTPIRTFATCALLLGVAGPSAAACEPDGEVQFLCGPVSPEDLAPVPQTPWVIVSSMVDEGHLYLADTRDHSSTILFPTETSRPRHDTATYGACPGPLTSQFRPHGLYLRPGDSSTHTLYVVGHGDRESIEVFEVEMGGASPALTWVGCAVAPDFLGLNSVVALPEGGFAATSPRTGDVWEWQTGTGWSLVPGSEDIGPNGLEISRDGQWFYVGGYGSQSLIRLSRGQTPVQKEAVEVGFHIDNVRWGPGRDAVCRRSSREDTGGHWGMHPAAPVWRCDVTGCAGQSQEFHRRRSRSLPLQRPPHPWDRRHSGRGGDLGRWCRRRRPDSSFSGAVKVAVDQRSEDDRFPNAVPWAGATRSTSSRRRTSSRVSR